MLRYFLGHWQQLSVRRIGMVQVGLALLGALLIATANVSAVSAQMPNFQNLQEGLKGGLKDIQDKLKDSPGSFEGAQSQGRRLAEGPKASGDSRRSTQAETSPESSWERSLCGL